MNNDDVLRQVIEEDRDENNEEDLTSAHSKEK